MPEVAAVDGLITPLAAAVVPVTDRGLLYGDHVFEVAVAVAGRVIDGPAHLARLADGAAQLGLPPPAAALPSWIAAALAAAALPRAVVRVVWTRGDGAGVRPSPTARGRAIVLVTAWTDPPPAPLTLATVAIDRSGRSGALVPAAVKSGNYLASVLALAAAEAVGADDALLVDPEDQVCETATGNVAIVEGGAVWFAAGAALAGVTAARVAALLRADGVVVGATAITRSRLAAADEVFVTSSRRGVVAVARLDDVSWRPGPTTARAADRYRAWRDGAPAGDAAPPAAL